MSDLLVQGVGMTSARTRDRMVQRLKDQGINDTRVLEQMRQVPRHLFLDEALAHRAYEDTALPIGHRQTLSQPYIVAKMTESLLKAANNLDHVLEIGTGSGYQTAVLAPFVKKITSVERIQALQHKAQHALRQLKIHNVAFRVSDGSFGLPDAAPFDAIISAAAPATVPDSLKQQLGPDGVLIIPVGETTQQLMCIQREGDSDSFIETLLEPVRFVPLLSGVVR